MAHITVKWSVHDLNITAVNLMRAACVLLMDAKARGI